MEIMQAVLFFSGLIFGGFVGFKAGYSKGVKVNRPVSDQPASRPDNIDRDLR